jgi:hypothetical protein
MLIYCVGRVFRHRKIRHLRNYSISLSFLTVAVFSFRVVNLKSVDVSILFVIHFTERSRKVYTVFFYSLFYYWDEVCYSQIVSSFQRLSCNTAI